jgi:homoserine kinase
MGLSLTIEAHAATEFQIEATGRDAELCARLDDNLILTTYRETLAAQGREAPPLRLRLDNEIPLGMGCGSSAAALLAGVLLANHFGELGWGSQQMLEEACRREGHPDNVAACWLGGMTVSAMKDGVVTTASCGRELTWRLLLALPSSSLATVKARALLPPTYSRADAVANVQNVALLVAAFAQGRPELLHAAMEDRLHQPYRAEACPLLPRLLPMSGQPGIYGVTLSGAGPSVLLVADAKVPVEFQVDRIRQMAGEPELEVVETAIAGGAKYEVL